MRADDGGSSAPQEIRLEPAPMLTVLCPPGWTSGPFQLQPLVRLDYDDDPYGPWGESGEDVPELDWRHHAHLHGKWRSGLSMTQADSTEYALESDGSLQVSGLRRGAAFDLSVVDCYRRSFVTESVVFDSARTFDLRDRPFAVATLVCRLATADGTPVPGGRVRLVGDDWSSYFAFDGDTIEIGPLVPAACRVSFRCGELGATGVEEVGLHDGVNERTFLLVPDED